MVERLEESIHYWEKILRDNKDIDIQEKAFLNKYLSKLLKIEKDKEKNAQIRVVETIDDSKVIRTLQVRKRFLCFKYWKNKPCTQENIIKGLEGVRKTLLSECKRGYLRDEDLSDFAIDYLRKGITRELNKLILDIREGKL